MTISTEQYPHDDPELIEALRREVESLGVKRLERQQPSSFMPQRAVGKTVIDVVGPTGLSDIDAHQREE